MLHEIQHWIQGKEGFAKGGNPAQLQAEINAKKSGILATLQAIDTTRAIVDLKNDPVYAGLNFGQNIENVAVARMLQKQGHRVSPMDIPRLRESQGISAMTGEDAYRRLSGEIEARDAAARMNLTGQQRARTGPYTSEDIPLNEWITRK
jgi:hypothetical protein